jgi:hypothetical protein
VPGSLSVKLIPLLIAALVVAGCLSNSDSPRKDDGNDQAEADSGLVFRPFVDLGSKARPGAFGTSCQDSLVDGDCGLGEPQVEVDALGTIYVSGVCCLTVAPPVYVSRDGGATFQDLATTTMVREQLGIEGDFAIDAQGRVYFADIEFAATFQVTVWDKDGAFIHHTKWPGVPIVDRDWIRAEGNGILYYVYNTGTSTNVYKSTDAGRTWSPAPLYVATYNLGMAVSGNAPGELWLLGGSLDGKRQADVTRDGGLTWAKEITTLPTGRGFPVGAMDEADSLFAGSDPADAIWVARRDPDGTWNEAVQVSPTGHHRMPWMATGTGPQAAVACWYGTPDTTIGSESQWYVHVGWSTQNGANGTWSTVIADKEPVFVGVLGRHLLDFFQCEVGPDGAVHVAYSKLRSSEGGPEEQLHYVRSEPMPALAASKYPWGPKA